MIYAINSVGEDAKVFETIWQARQELDTDLIIRPNTNDEIISAICETKDFVMDEYECEYTGGDAMWSVTLCDDVLGMLQISDDMTLTRISQLLRELEKLNKLDTKKA